MAKGFSIPFRANHKGRVVLSDGDTHLAELLGIAFGSGDSNNPFQELGLGEDMVFENATEELFNNIAVKIRTIFENFEDEELAKLQDRTDNLEMKVGSEEGTWEMVVYYINLERDAPGTFKVFGGRAEGITVEAL